MEWLIVENEIKYRKMELERICQGKKRGIDTHSPQKKNRYLKRLVNFFKNRLLRWSRNQNPNAQPSTLMD